MILARLSSTKAGSDRRVAFACAFTSACNVARATLILKVYETPEANTLAYFDSEHVTKIFPARDQRLSKQARISETYKL